MLGAALVAFGHFLAFFALTAASVLSLALISENMSAEAARRIRRADRVAAVSAVLLLVFGTLRVMHYEKGAAYYADNLYFQIKIALFVIAALISIYPTVQFVRWGAALKRGEAPVLSALQVKRLKSAIHWELVLIAGILLCASLMARGFGT